MSVEDYDRANRVQHAISDDDDLWRANVMREDAAALEYFKTRIENVSAPFAALSGMVSVAGRLAGISSREGFERDVINELHQILDSMFWGGCEMKSEMDYSFDLNRERRS